MNPKSVSSIFGNDIPSLNNAFLKKVNFDNNGPLIEIFFDIENYPSTPPIKWIQNGYNTAQMWMKFIEVASVRLDGWKRDNLVDIELKEIEDDLIYLRVLGNGCNIELSFRWLDVGVTGYVKETVK